MSVVLSLYERLDYMTKPISVGKEASIPGREQILEGKQEGWEIFCAFCVESLTKKLNGHHWFRKEGTAKQIALSATTKIFLDLNDDLQTLENMKPTDELEIYLSRSTWRYRRTTAREQLKLAQKPMTPEEREEKGKGLNNYPRVFGLACPDPERVTTARELYALATNARSYLSTKHGEALDRATWGDSHEMIGQALGMNKKAVGQELNRARKELLRHMPEDSFSALEMFVGGSLRKLRCRKPRTKRAGASQMSAVVS